MGIVKLLTYADIIVKPGTLGAFQSYGVETGPVVASKRRDVFGVIYSYRRASIGFSSDAFLAG